MRLRISAIALLGFASLASASTVYDEGVTGDISGAGATPTPITLSLGTNTLIGSLRTSSATDNQDFLQVTIPAGLALQSYVHTLYTSTDAQGFTGFRVGSTFTVSTGLAGSYNGYAHFGSAATNGSLPAQSTVGVDLFPWMADNSAGGTSAGAAGFAIPLSSGVYTFLIQQTGSGPTTAYQFDFNVVPEPASLGVVLLGGAMLAAGRRTRLR